MRILPLKDALRSLVIAPLPGVTVLTFATHAAIQTAQTSTVHATLRWRVETPPNDDYVLALGVGKDGTIYAGSWIGSSVFGFAPDGTLRRKLSVGRGAKALCIGRDGTIYVGTGDYRVDTFAADGTPKSTVEVKKPSAPGGGVSIEALAAGDDGVLYVAVANDLYAVDTHGVRSLAMMQGPIDTLAIGRSQVIYAGAGDTVYVFRADGTLKSKWYVGTRAGIFDTVSIVAIAAGRRDVVYVGTRDRIVFALDAKDGSIKWRFKPTGTPFAVAEGDNGDVYVGSYDGNIYALDPRNGTLRWRFSTGHGSWGQNPVHALAVGSESVLYAGVGNSVESIRLPR